MGSPGAVDRQFVWGLRYIDDFILRDRDSSNPPNGVLDQRVYSLQDANFNVVALVTVSQGVVKRHAYEAYGNPVFLTPDYQAGSTTLYNWDYYFCGYYRDRETFLYQVRHRHYHPALGRWLQRDPIGYEAGWNLYEYVGGGPTGLLDPQGLKPFGEIEISLRTVDSFWTTRGIITWYHPRPRSQPSSCECTRVRIYQIADTTEIVAGGISPISAINRPWHYDDIALGADLTDWIAGNFGGSDPMHGQLGSNSIFARVQDDTGRDSDAYAGRFGITWRRVAELNQRFETCAVCIEPQGSKHYLEVFGCVNWRVSVMTNALRKVYIAGRPFNISLDINPTQNPDEVLRSPRASGVRPSDTFLSEMKSVGLNTWW